MSVCEEGGGGGGGEGVLIPISISILLFCEWQFKSTEKSIEIVHKFISKCCTVNTLLYYNIKHKVRLPKSGLYQRDEEIRITSVSLNVNLGINLLYFFLFFPTMLLIFFFLLARGGGGGGVFFFCMILNSFYFVHV